MRTSTSSYLNLPENTDRLKRYDRQLRLWGDHGQTQLERSSVCVVKASITNTEMLKSLVLAGIGSFTLVDEGRLCTIEDVDDNFFLAPSSVGKVRAEEICNYLLEISQDVKGCVVNETLESLLKSDSNFFHSFSVVIVSQVCNEKLISLLSEVLWSLNIPLVVCFSCGFFAYFKLQYRQYCTIESHPDNEIVNLRLLDPFPSLVQYMDAVSLEEMNSTQLSHVPYAVLLYKSLQKWYHHYGEWPLSYSKKTEFRAFLKTYMQKLADLTENYDEADKAANSCLSLSKISPELCDLMNCDACTHLNAKSTKFWIMMHALKRFVTYEGQGRYLPVRGYIPDMFSDSKQYISLQKIYLTEARNNLEHFMRHVQQLLSGLDNPIDFISEDEMKLFCRNTHSLKVIDGSKISNEFSQSNFSPTEIAMRLQNEAMLSVYVVLRGMQRYYSEFSMFPAVTSSSSTRADSVSDFKSCIGRMLAEWGCSYTLQEEYVSELCRYDVRASDSFEFHPTSSFIGGCVAHEVIKLITHQYIPVNNTYIYNGVNCVSETIRC